MIHVHELAAACNRTGFPFYLGLAIMEKESTWTINGKRVRGGANIFGHDQGGAMYVDPPAYVEVTETSYAKFKQLLAGGARSNGVGPMQLTYKPYFAMMESRGLKPYKAADSILFAVELLAAAFNAQLRSGKTAWAAFWETARAYNGGSDPQRGRTYADDALHKAAAWLAVVGNVDAPSVTIGRTA